MSGLKIAIPDGSMQEKVTSLLENAGLPVVVENERTKEGKVDVDWIESIVFQRPQEIPLYLKAGHFDVVIVGEDWIANWGFEFPVLLRMPVGRRGNQPIKIVLAVHRASGITRITDLPPGCEVATEYVELAKRFFERLGRSDIIVLPSYGNTEHKVRYGATAIIDVIESGDSLIENNLVIIDQLMESCTVVVANPASLADRAKKPYIDTFTRLIKGAVQASQYVLMIANVPEAMLEKASRIIGGLKGPTRSPLTVK